MQQKVCVFCAASEDCDSFYLDEAYKLGKYLAQTGRDIVYGGGRVGLMGRLADGALSCGGRVTGVIPTFMYDSDLGHPDITETIVVNNMHSRKLKMYEESCSIIALPGGIGTIDELIEALCWKRLGILFSPVIIVNINKYFDPLIEMLDKTIKYNFTPIEYAHSWLTVDSVDEALEYLNYLNPVSK